MNLTVARGARRRRGRPRESDRGSHAVEFAAGWAIFALATGVLGVAFQVGSTRADVAQAAREAARAASLATTVDGARDAADVTARRGLASAGTCTPDSMTVSTNTDAFGPGGTVTVAVGCHVRPVAGIGPSRWISATGDAVVDQYRGGIGGTG